MTTETVAAYLRRMARRDLEKDGIAFSTRTTREIADYFGWSVRKALRQLQSLELAGEVECLGVCDYEPGQPYEWRAAPGPDNDNDEQSVAERIAA